MRKRLRYLFSHYTFCKFENNDLNEKFYIFRQALAYKQITAISLVTAFGYILMSFVSRYTAPQELLPTISNLQLYLIAPYMLILSYLGYKRIPFLVIEIMIFLAPLLALSVHILIISKLPSHNTYQTELYLMIFWIFTVSGMSFLHSIITAIIVFSVGIISSNFLYPDEMDSLIIYSMWMAISLAFGFVGGYLLEDSNRTSFLKEIELKKLAIHDALTGLYNRARLDKILNSELHRASRYKNNFGIMMIDIDFFKAINDSYGHLVGDKVLIQISQHLTQSIRSSDTLFRWGGEEFVIVSLEVDEKTLFTLAQNIRKAVQNIQFEDIDALTVSIGVTIYHENDDSASLMKRADKALYNAKENNRNCVKLL